MARPSRTSKGSKHHSKHRGKAVAEKNPKDHAKPKGMLSRYGLTAVALFVLTSAIIITTRGVGSRPTTITSGEANPAAIQLTHHAYTTQGPRTLEELLALPDDELEQLDIALINLICAEGLPGAEDLDIDGTLAALDEWARHVQRETDKELYKFYADPAAWDHSEGRWRMGLLVTALQLDCGVHYNLARARDVDFTKSKDLFIHGMVAPGMDPVYAVDHPEEAQQLIDSTNGGTCVSMPVIYTAVARRLGYPVSLSSTKGHVFCRWDGSDNENPAYRDYFNIEGTNRGINIYDDDHYLAWPYAIGEQYAEHHALLRTEDNTATLAAFLATRGHCLLDTGNLHQAIRAYRHAATLAPDVPYYHQFFAHANAQLLPPEMRPGLHGARQATRTGTSQHRTIDQELAWIQQMNAENQRRQEAMLQAQPQPGQSDPFYPDDPYTTPNPGQPQLLDPFNNPALPSPAGFP